MKVFPPPSGGNMGSINPAKKLSELSISTNKHIPNPKRRGYGQRKSGEEDVRIINY
jgi:hypothetical protein